MIKGPTSCANTLAHRLGGNFGLALTVLAAAGAAAAALWAGTAQPAAAATLTAGPGGLQFAGLVSAPEPSAATDATSLQSGLFLPSEPFTPTDPCLPPSLI